MATTLSIASGTKSILDSGWVNQVYPNVSLARAAIGDVYCHPVLYGDVLFNRGFIPLGMQRSFFIQYCFSGNSGSPARWEIRFGNGVARSYELVFGKFTGHASRHFARWHPPEWYHFLSLLIHFVGYVLSCFLIKILSFAFISLGEFIHTVCAS